jgi:hypothetical protein
LNWRVPGWDLHQIFGGYLAVPAGTPVVLGSDVESVVTKIREREQQGDT